MYQLLNPAIDKGILVAIWHAMSPNMLAQFAQHIFEEYSYRAGWPDLTLVREGNLRFIEVKTTDKFHASQRQIIMDILQPQNADVRVIQIT